MGIPIVHFSGTLLGFCRPEIITMEALKVQTDNLHNKYFPNLSQVGSMTNPNHYQGDAHVCDSLTIRFWVDMILELFYA